MKVKVLSFDDAVKKIINSRQAPSYNASCETIWHIDRDTWERQYLPDKYYEVKDFGPDYMFVVGETCDFYLSPCVVTNLIFEKKDLIVIQTDYLMRERDDDI